MRLTSAPKLLLTLLLSAPALLAPSLPAQTVTGSITGAVTDPSGAVVPHAHVTAENTATGVKTESTTNDAGAYTIRFLPIGTYRVVVDAPGFNSSSVAPFALEIDQTAKINATLTIGSSTTTVDVQGEAAPILNTNDSSLGVSLSTNEIANIPLNGRNFSSVTIFQPGAVVTDPQGLSGINAIERSQFSNGVASINGNRNQANSYTLDGIDMNEPQNNLIAYNPAPDALAEVRVISANANASYGNANGGDIVSILKSGTNQLHGSAYGYLENYNLDANTWAHKLTNPISPRDRYTQSIFGGTLGGPIFRDKLFFFVDYEGTRRHSADFASASVLTAAMRQGDFSTLLSQGNGGIQLYDTQNNFVPYVNNQVPVVSPVAKFLFAHPELYPLPNATPSDGLIQNNFQAPTKTSILDNQGDIKIEYDTSARNKFTTFYAQSNAQDVKTAIIPAFFSGPNFFPTKLGGGSWIHTFSKAVVNEARIGFTRVRWDQGVPIDPSGLFGTRGNSVVGISFANQTYQGFSDQNFQNSTLSDVGTTANPQQFRDNTFSYQDNLTWQRGRHLLSFGAQAIRYQQNYVNASNFGFLGQQQYGGYYTSNPNLATGAGGYSPADFVLDRVYQTQIASALGRVSNRQWRDAGYIQDDFRASSKLTLNIGLRYEYDQPWYEANNKTANVLLDTGQVEYAGSLPSGAVPGSKVCPTRACYNATYNQLQPRLGFAFQAAPRFVIRGGYGGTSFFEGYSFNQRLTTSPPFASGALVKGVTPGPATKDAPFGTPGTPRRVEDGFGQTLTNNSGYSVWPQNTQPAYIHQFNLTTEYELTNKLSITVGYLGETGQHLADYRNANQLTLTQAAIVTSSPDPNNPLPGGAAPYANLVGQGGVLLVTESNAMMNYNGGQATLRQRANHGFEYTINYTYSKSMTNSAGDYGQPGINGSNGSYQNGFDARADYGPAGQDIRHNLNAVGVYAVPYGRSQQYGAGTNRIVDLIAGGWSISGSIINYSGLPITINGPGNTNTNSYGQSRANQYRKLIIRNRSVNHWFGTDPTTLGCSGQPLLTSTCAYGAATTGFGTASINTERAPGYRQIDTSAFKDFHLFESHTVGFRADFFNVFNIASYGNPDNGVTDSNFGQITSVRSPPRQIQFSAHYTF